MPIQNQHQTDKIGEIFNNIYDYLLKLLYWCKYHNIPFLYYNGLVSFDVYWLNYKKRINSYCQSKTNPADVHSKYRKFVYPTLVTFN